MQRVRQYSILLLAAGALLVAACGPSTPPPTPPAGTVTPIQVVGPLVSAAAGTRAISADGQVVALRVTGTAGTEIRLWTAGGGPAQAITTAGNGGLEAPSVSADGSVVLFTQQSGQVVPGLTATGDEFFLHDVAAGTTERIEVPDTLSRAAVTRASISGDGSLVVLNRGHHVLQWTRDGGFVEIGQPAGDLLSVEAASLSADGRFVTVRSVREIASDPTRYRSDYVVLDREAGTVHAASEGPSWVPDILQPTGFDFRLAATTDDGGAIYSFAEGGGAYVLDGATGTTSPLPRSGGAAISAASHDGVHVGVRTPPQFLPPAPSLHRVVDRTDGSALSIGWTVAGDAGAWGVADGGRRILVLRQGADAPAGPGFYLWDRDG